MLKWAVTKTPKEWRIKHGLTQEQMAEMLGISRVAYNRIETGSAIPKTETLLRMNHLSSETEYHDREGEYRYYSSLRIPRMYEIYIEEQEEE